MMAIGVSRFPAEIQSPIRSGHGLCVAAWQAGRDGWPGSEQDQSGALLCSSTSRFLVSAGEATNNSPAAWKVP